MSSYDSVQSFAQRATEQLTRLGIVILDAIVMQIRHEPLDGSRGMVQVIYLLTTLLGPSCSPF